MLRNILLICLLSLLVGQSLGQTVIEGNLISSKNETLVAVSVIAYDASKSNILAYNFSDDAGSFRLSFNYKGNKIYLTTQSLSYRDTVLILQNKSQKITLSLVEELNEIEEVQVEGYPISERGDTIIYTVKSFAQQKDNSIGDVIKRMPGFKVSPSGQIEYQGRKIEKYYIEGLDLLENRYSIANRSLPYKSVTSVEVLQNHQPVKMLRGKTFADGTSLNIRLGKKVAKTGTVYAGSGLSPFLYDVNFSPMLFTKKQQIVASAQFNNIGEDLDKQFKPVFIDYSNLQSLKNRKDELLSISSVFKPEIEENRYLDNKAVLFTYNHLLRLNKDLELKVNTAYYKDIIEEKNKIISSFFTPQHNLVITEQTDNKYHNNRMYTELSLMQNSPKKYLKNKLTFDNYWDKEHGVIQNLDTINQTAKTPHHSLSNNLELYLPVKNNFINIYSFIDYNHSPQSISFMPGVFKKELNKDIDYQRATQNYTKHSFITENHLNFYYKRGYWAFNSELGFNYERQNIETFVEIAQYKLVADSLNNNLTWDYFKLYYKERIEYEKDDFRFAVLIPIEQLFYQINDAYYRSPSSLQKTFYTPSIYLRKAISNYWNTRFSIKYISSIETAEQLMQGYLIKDYRRINKKAAKIPDKQGFGCYVGVEYKHPVSGFFSNLKYHGSFLKYNLLNKYINKGNGVWYYDAVEKENYQMAHNLSLELKHFISKIRTSIGIVSTYNNRQREYLSDNIVKDAIITAFSVTPSLSISFLQWCDIGYNYSFHIVNQKTPEKTFTFFNHKHKGNIYFNFSTQQQLGFELEYYETSSEKEKSSTFFSDISYFYKPDKSKFRFRVKLNNIFNQNEYTKYFHSDIYMSKNIYQIRPRQFIFTIFYNL